MALLFLLPSLVIVGAFGFLPLFRAAQLSLQEWKLAPGPFVGLENYRQALFREPELWSSLGVTLWFVLGTVPTTLALAYLLAELLQRRLRGLAFYRLLFFTPYVVSPVAAAAVWLWLLNPQFGLATAAAGLFGARPEWLREEQGVFRLAAEALGLGLPKWAAGPSLALVCIMAVTVWHNLGFAVVILLAALGALPEGVLEAARLDGARGWRLMRSVRLPLITPTLFMLMVILTIRAFQNFTQLYVLSPDHRGGPDGTTQNITLYIFLSAYQNQARLGLGYASAVALLLFLIILALTLLQFRVLGRRVHYQ
ncbi:MAG: carbohydrate ABC transporter permease [Armatimonadota bacterium]